jgi:hypothetical protein
MNVFIGFLVARMRSLQCPPPRFLHAVAAEVHTNVTSGERVDQVISPPHPIRCRGNVLFS